MLCVVACGGGGSSLATGGSSGGGETSNVQSAVIDNGPSAVANSQTPALNTLYTTVTICVPGSTTSCQTIDHIQVDTGSSGFRILADSGFSLSLPNVSVGGNTLAECLPFVDGSSYGSVRAADIKIAGETASNIEIEVIGDTAYPVPTDGSCAGTPENTVATFGANGIIGVGNFVSDCGPNCNTYYTCPTPTTCAQSTAITEAEQVSNPVASFATDNNGIIIEIPAVAAGGAASVTGSIIFGIGTQTNNTLASATVIPLSADDGSFTTQYKGSSLTESFFDTGSNGYFFNDSSITQCTDNSGFYCPASTLSETATLVGSTGSPSVAVTFSVASESALLSGPVIAAAPGLAGTLSDTNSSSGLNASLAFDWGLPFFFGRNVYVAIDGAATTGTTVTGPYVAF
jgi:hypothetical protein